LGLPEQRDPVIPIIITITRSLLTKKLKNLVVLGKATNLVLRENELPICDGIKDAVSALDQPRLGTDSSDILSVRLVACRR
jgi:hypothetical protein